MNSSGASRYEYRVFQRHLSDVQDYLESRGRLLTAKVSDEVYILSRLNTHTNLKIRCEKLELKTLRKRQGGLELWEPSLRVAFPITPELARRRLAPVLGGNLELENRKGSLALSDLIKIAERHEDLAPLRVEKMRRKYKLERDIGEIVRVSSGNKRIDSAAVESEDPGRASALIKELGLQGFANLSYPAFLQQWAFA